MEQDDLALAGAGGAQSAVRLRACGPEKEKESRAGVCRAPASGRRELRRALSFPEARCLPRRVVESPRRRRGAPVWSLLLSRARFEESSTHGANTVVDTTKAAA